MIALQLTNVKSFMNQLLLGEMFDHFLLQEASILTFCHFQIDGRINRTYGDDSNADTAFHVNADAILSESGFLYEQNAADRNAVGEFIPFRRVKNSCLQLIKGKQTPSSFHFVFLLSPSNMEKTLQASGCSFVPSDLTGLFINIRYQNNLLVLTTGISYKNFSMDKSLDRYWDRTVELFMKKYDISYEKMA